MSSIYKDPLDQILASIKSLNNVDLVKAEYTFGLPVAVEVDGAGTNTTVLITSKDLQSTYDGQVTVRYRRLNLADLTTLVPLSIKADLPTTTLQVAERLNQLYGLKFTADDIESTPVDLSGTDGAGTVTLVAKDTSLAWIGSVVVTLARGAIPIADRILVTNLPGLYMPNRDDTKPYGEVYSVFRDLSAYAEGMQLLALGTGSLQDLATILTSATGDAWVINGSARYSLDGATIVFNDVTSGDPRLKTNMERAVIVNLSTNLSLGLSGSLLLHYNLPDGFED